MKAKTKLVIVAALIAVIAAAGILSLVYYNATKDGKVIVGRAANKNLTQTLVLNGYIEANNRQTIKLPNSIKITQIYAVKGQDVQKGDPILTLDDREYQHQLSIAQISLEKLQKELQTLTSQTRDNKKDAEYNVTQALLELRNQELEYTKAKNKYEQSQTLFEGGAISKEEYDSAKDAMDKAKNLMELKNIAYQKATDELKGFDTSHEERVYRLKKDIELAKENIDSLDILSDANPKAEIAGRVVKMDLETGSITSDSNATIIIDDLSRYIINLKVKQNDSLYLDKGQSATIRIKGLEGKEYIGKIEEIDDIAQPSDRSNGVSYVNIRLVINAPDKFIKVGYQAEIKLNLRVKVDTIVVDYRSILQDAEGNKYLYFVEGNEAQRRPVKTGIENKFEVEILEGIIAGDRYLINPTEAIQDRDKVKIWGWGYEFR